MSSVFRPKSRWTAWRSPKSLQGRMHPPECPVVSAWWRSWLSPPRRDWRRTSHLARPPAIPQGRGSRGSWTCKGRPHGQSCGESSLWSSCHPHQGPRSSSWNLCWRQHGFLFQNWKKGRKKGEIDIVNWYDIDNWKQVFLCISITTSSIGQWLLNVNIWNHNIW